MLQAAQAVDLGGVHLGAPLHLHAALRLPCAMVDHNHVARLQMLPQLSINLFVVDFARPYIHTIVIVPNHHLDELSRQVSASKPGADPHDRRRTLKRGHETGTKRPCVRVSYQKHGSPRSVFTTIWPQAVRDPIALVRFTPFFVVDPIRSVVRHTRLRSEVNIYTSQHYLILLSGRYEARDPRILRVGRAVERSCIAAAALAFVVVRV
mmetsp:Transcript_7408/g.19251  ORF Transcript_7408/g.19251 Transcript_7408/m.19251 type:complete len:208 (+) Transcript_7408:627-1250(+)